MWTVD
ncbi:hypothetical protein Patl1_15266 [Pistacia atlantica]